MNFDEEQELGAIFSDSSPFWALAMDMLPCEKRKLMLCIKSSRENKVCNPETGAFVENSRCEIEVQVIFDQAVSHSIQCAQQGIYGIEFGKCQFCLGNTKKL